MIFEDIIKILSTENGLNVDAGSFAVLFSTPLSEKKLLIERGEGNHVFASVNICSYEEDTSTGNLSNFLLSLNSDIDQLGKARLSIDYHNKEYYLFDDLGSYETGNQIILKCEFLVGKAYQINQAILERNEEEQEEEEQEYVEPLSENITILRL